MDCIYLDNNASTPMLPPVWEAMRPYFAEAAGNPASSHRAGRRARQALEDARERTAALLDASPDEVVFTSGATEANNLAVFGLAGDPPGSLLASSVEHPCVLEPLQRLAERGFSLQLLPVDAEGSVHADALSGQLREDTRLVSVMLANHETGALQPVARLAAELAGRAPLHCDAAAAVGKIPVRFHDLGVTALTVSAHKFHGPKGVGALLLRRGARLRPQLWGGHQQQGRRPGTEPVALVVGLATALQLATTEHEARRRHVERLRALFLEARRRGAGHPQRPGEWGRAAHAEPVHSRLPGGRAADEPRPCGRGLLDRVGVLQRVAAPLTGAAGDGRAGRGTSLGDALQLQLSARRGRGARGGGEGGAGGAPVAGPQRRR
jgi:cysteine desulfurase